jgi:hypothetical protein
MVKRVSPTDVIDLTENDKESVEKEGRNATLQSLRERLSHIPEAGVAAAVLPTLKKVKWERTEKDNTRENLATTGEDTDATDDDRKPAAKSKTTDHEMEKDDVEVLEALPRNVPTTATAAARSKNSGEEIEVVGTVNQVLLPHMRQHCTKEP